MVPNRVENVLRLERLFRPERGREELTYRLHVSIADPHAKALLMRGTHAVVEEVEREHLLTFGRHVTEAALQVWHGIGLDELLHGLSVAHRDDDRADRGDQSGDGDHRVRPARQAAVMPRVWLVDFRCFHGELSWPCAISG